MVEAQFADVVETQPELLAHHYTEAGLAASALPYYRLAGAKAVARSAYREAVALFEQALRVMQPLPDCRDTIAQAIDLRLALRTALRPLGEFDRAMGMAFGYPRQRRRWRPWSIPRGTRQRCKAPHL